MPIFVSNGKKGVPEDRPDSGPVWRVWGARAPVVVATSFAATAFPFVLADALWPEGLHANAAFFFWPASGMNLAWALIWGKWTLFLIPLNGLLAATLLGQPAAASYTGAVMNMLEAGLGAFLLSSHLPLGRHLDRPGTVQRLTLVSLAMGGLTSIIYNITLLASRAVPPDQIGASVVSTWMSNACGVMFLTPLMALIAREGWKGPVPAARGLGWSAATLAVGTLAFSGVFGDSINYVFLVFPLMIFAAVTQPFSLLPRMLFLLMITVYLALGLRADGYPAEQTAGIIWFTQAVGWTLVVTTLMLGALMAENRRKERDVLRHREEVMESRYLLEREQLKTLRYQVNPHFLFNALNSIYAVIPSGAEAPRRMLLSLSSYFRSTLEDSGEEGIPLEAEMERLRDYLRIEQARFGEDLQVHVGIDPEVRKEPLPRFLLQPLVENAIRHGLEATREGFELEITARGEDAERYRIDLVNTGTYRPDPRRREGIGLENVRKRMELFHGKEGTLRVDALDNRVRVRLSLPRSCPEEVE